MKQQAKRHAKRGRIHKGDTNEKLLYSKTS